VNSNHEIFKSTTKITVRVKIRHGGKERVLQLNASVLNHLLG
jgi:hypothetical protein